MKKEITNIISINTNFVLIFLSFLSIVSCKKEDQSFNTFQAKVNDIPIEPGAECNRNISNDDTVFVIHSLAMNNSTEMFYFYNIPIVKTVTEFYDQEIDFSLLSIDDVTQGTKRYRPISGKLVVYPPVNNYIEGSFNLVVVCNDSIRNDTVIVNNGHFKISYSTIWIR